MNKNIEYKTPPKFTAPFIKYFLEDVTDIFKCTNKYIPNVKFILSNTTTIDVSGIILIYKFFEYTIRKNCFFHPTYTLDKKSELNEPLKKYGFWDLIDDYVNKKPIGYNKLQVKSLNELVIVPFFLNKDSKKDEVSINSDAICKYYNNKYLTTILLTCIGEVASNFRSHSVSDTKSILAAKGTRKNFEFACSDTGNGIVSTLRPTLVNSGKGLQPHDIIEQALKKGVSSKDKKTTDHMGMGLWMVNELVTAGKGQLHIYSEGAYVKNINGTIRKGACAYWKGTIIYVNLPLGNIDVYTDRLNKILSEKR